MKIAFNNKKYLKEEKKLLLERAKKFDTLFLEIGGHLLSDSHASRVLPRYNPKNKLKLIKSLGKKAGLVYCVSAKNFDNEYWSTTNNNIEKFALKEIKILKKEIDLLAVVINRFEGEEKALQFIQKIEKLGLKVIVTTEIPNYPNLKASFSKKGFADQAFIKTNKKIVVVTGAGANNGKLFFCLNQIYHFKKEKTNIGYAKIETFPIWNLPLEHEVNLAYEAATADINDKILLDPYHKKEYGVKAVNYNRDIESFKILKKIISKIISKNNFMHSYASPTDMGLNAIKKGIVDDKKCREAGRKEIFRRKKFFEKTGDKKAIKRVEKIIKKLKKTKQTKN
jgi:uncharacterized protein (UPF0371 family)